MIYDTLIIFVHNNNKNNKAVHSSCIAKEIVQLTEMKTNWVKLSPDICMWRWTRCSVTTAPENGSHVLEKPSLQQVLEGAQRQFGDDHSILWCNGVQLVTYVPQENWRQRKGSRKTQINYHYS